MNIVRIAALGAALALGLAGCADSPPPAAQVSSADLARQASAPIDVSPHVAGVYHDKYLATLDGATSGIFAISPNGNRFEIRTCHHPDCQMSDDEIATRALDRCNLGFAAKHPENRCLVFDRNGKIAQPHRFWTDADFAMPVPAPPALSLNDRSQLADPRVTDDRYVVMTPEGQIRISLHADGSAYFWDTGDYFHQGVWALVQGGVCIESMDGRSFMACGTLYGADPRKPAGATLDLFPGKFLPVTRLTSTAE